MSEVDESFDEDVVLSGPLHEYLQTCGDDGFPTSLVDTLPSTSKDASSTPMNDFGRSNLIDVTALFKSAKLEQDRIERVSDLIIHSNLIDSIDEHLIDEERVGDAGRSVTSSNSTALWSCVGCAVLSSVGSRFTSGRLANCFAAAAGVSAALSSVFMTSACWQRFKLRRFKQHVSSYIALEQTMDGNIRDAIRAVRQRQVVLYGLLSTNSEMKQSHLSAEGCFLPLRVALFSALRSAILHTRDETQRLAKRLCSVDELRNLTSSSSQCEFDALLSDSSPPVDLATIKAVWHWYYLLRSEYLRCVSWG
uniref:Uncharacterized protein n=1 Tax=Plectus sambesii TaxID=2011161 RepID=A0A914X8I7_9BILA